MNKGVLILFVFFESVFALSFNSLGQEFVGPLRYNALLEGKPEKGAPVNRSEKKTAALLTLPFFEDFTGYSVYPDTNKWVEDEVYVNNTMCVSPVSRGVATFDALDRNGIPYDSFSNINFRYADSLTSQPIDLSTVVVGDSLYFSFFYQPQGNGYYPLPADSLMLYFKDKYGGFVKVWSTPGTTLQPFQQVMIPVTDSIYYHNAFQFRFVNIAALYWADAVWNVDYIRMNTGRSIGDTSITDVAFTTDPPFLLNDYSYMPYNQFMANPASEIAPQIADSIRNSGSFSQTVNYSFSITDAGSGATLAASAAPGAAAFSGYQTQQVTNPFSIATYPSYPLYQKVDFETTYFLTAPLSGPTANDTIVKEQVFDNFLAYDDGTAEKGYYLILSPTLQGRIAIEFHLNQPDTMVGLAIYFARQAPIPNYKNFDIFVFSALQGINGAAADVALDSQEFYVPQYTDTQNHFWLYKFDSPLILPAGTFYAGTRQEAEANDDTLYLGLDVNRIGSNHAYFNVLNVWQPSLVSGAIMMRPILGRQAIWTAVADVRQNEPKWRVMPNPARDMLQLEMDASQQPSVYRITDIQGHCVLQGDAVNGRIIDISLLAPGIYLVNIITDGVTGAPQKIVKL